MLTQHGYGTVRLLVLGRYNSQATLCHGKDDNALEILSSRVDTVAQPFFSLQAVLITLHPQGHDECSGKV